MAINTNTIVVITGAASATLATAVSNYNAAVATLYANAGGAIWNPNTLAPNLLQGGAQGDSGTTYAFWGMFGYLSAS